MDKADKNILMIRISGISFGYGYVGAGDWGFNSLPLPCILSRDTSCSIIGMSFVLGFRTRLPVFLGIGVAIHSAWKIFHHCSLIGVY